MSRWAVVVPSNRPERLNEFLDAWAPIFSRHAAAVYIVLDLDGVPGGLSIPYQLSVDLFSRRQVPDFIPTGTDMIRSYGFYRAWKEETLWTLSLDDDVLPPPGRDPLHEYAKVFKDGAPSSVYYDVGAHTTFRGQMRGFPQAARIHRPVGLQAGGWGGSLDYDALTQLTDPRADGNHSFDLGVFPVPKGAACTVCAMNMAFPTSLTPLFWQFPLVDGRYNRYGDIWGGLLAKRALDAMDYATVINGYAQVDHDRASDPYVNLVREALGLRPNEGLWDALSAPDYAGLISQAADYFRTMDAEYADALLDRGRQWLALFAS